MRYLLMPLLLAASILQAQITPKEEALQCEGILCYDSCLERFVLMKKSNTCNDYFDPKGFCWSVYGTCEEKYKSDNSNSLVKTK